MLTQRTEGLYRLFLLCQIVLVGTVFWFGVWLMVTFYSDGTGEMTWRRYSIYCVLLVFGLTLESLSRDGSKNYFLQSELLRQHRLSLRQTFSSIGTLVLYLIATKDAFISRLFFFNFVPWLYIVLLFSHHYLPSFLARKIFHGVREEKTVLIGSAKRAAQLRGWLNRKARIGLRTVGLLADDYDGSNVGIPVLGTTNDLDRIITEGGVTQVILLEYPLFGTLHESIVTVCDRHPVRLLIVSDLEEKLRHPVTHFEDEGVRFIALREEPLENPLNRFLKRAIDLAVALPMLIVALPISTLIVWIAQRLQSPGPLFHRQTRAGLQNRKFTIYKFRTMRADHGAETRQATEQDDRVYPMGRWFRKLSVDEIPQLWNVVRGDMSIVGPRPHLVEHNAQFAQVMTSYHVRAFVKPGMTGLAQVRGYRGEARNDSDIANRVACDIEYLENWNLSLELGIILRTLRHVLMPPRSAY